MPFEFRRQHDFDLHIALEVPRDVLEKMMAKAKAAGIETSGISDRQFINSIYFRDPNGYVIELTAKRPGRDEAMDPARNGARSTLQLLAVRQTARQSQLAKSSCEERAVEGRSATSGTATLNH